jgi:RNA binding exosome subunit
MLLEEATQKSGVERFNLRKPRELEVRKQYQIKVSDRFAAMENLDNSEHIKRAWEDIKENIKTAAKDSPCLYELEQHKLCFDEECSLFLEQRKQAKMEQLQDPNQSSVDTQNNVRREARRHFRKEKKEYLKD